MTTDPQDPQTPPEKTTPEQTTPESEAVIGWVVVLSTGLIGLGIMAILMPRFASAFITSILGAIALISGILQMAQAVQAKSFKGLAWSLGVGLLYAIAGLYILFNLAQALEVLSLAFGVLFIIEGVFTILMAFTYRVGRTMSWLVAINGIITLILGILVINRWPYGALWLIGLYVGISLLLSGASLLGSALAVRKEAA